MILNRDSSPYAWYIIYSNAQQRAVNVCTLRIGEAISYTWFGEQGRQHGVHFEDECNGRQLAMSKTKCLDNSDIQGECRRESEVDRIGVMFSQEL